MTSSSVFASGNATPAGAGRPPWLEWATAGRPFPGERVSGDAAFVDVSDAGAIVAVVDGLGHGPAAAEAAHRALAAVREPAARDTVTLVQRCHSAAVGTRGAAVALAALDRRAASLDWVGVGNVEGRLLCGAGAGREPSRSLLLSPGVLGHALPELRPLQLPLRRGDVLVLATDGIDLAGAGEVDPTGTPQRVADALLHDHARDADDALVVVARFLGGAE